MIERGLVHAYTGDGKGKTTAAVGLAVRCAGAGNRVLFVQFLKGQPTGELGPLDKLGIEVVRSESVKKFIPYMTEDERKICKAEQEACLNRAAEGLGRYDLIVLDEILGAVSMGMIECSAVAELIRKRPPNTEMVLTGRDLPPELEAIADYVSEVKCLRHPYDRGVTARRGIEY